MTSEIFRSSAERVGRMRELLNDPVLAAAIVCMQDEQPKGDVRLGDEAIASARLLSQQAGWQGAIQVLLSLAEPIIPESEEPKPTWGVELAETK